MNKSIFVCLFLFWALAQGLPATCQTTPGQGQPGGASSQSGAVPSFPGQKTDWHGYDRYDFVLDEATGAITPFQAPQGEGTGVREPAQGQRRCVLVVPKEMAPGNPWSWRGCYWDYAPQTETELLRRGFCIAYISASATLRPDKDWETWYAFLTDKYHLSPKPAFIGMSRGGMFAYDWATNHPDAVSCIYADNPAVTSESLTKLSLLAARDVPLLNICGSIDPLLGYNTLTIESLYHQMGGRISVMIKEGYGHHPHSLRDVHPIADWIEQNWKTSAPVASASGRVADGTPPFGQTTHEGAPSVVGTKYLHSNYYSTANLYTFYPAEGIYISCRGPWFTGNYDRYQFNLEGVDGGVTLTLPQKEAPGKPWVFRVGYGGREAAMDLALLAQGYAIVTGPVSYNRDSLSLKDWDAVYQVLVRSGYSAKPVLEGAGGAGGQAFGWAVHHPDKVSCIYTENPVLRTSFSPEQPMDGLEALARANVPILAVCGRLDPAYNDQLEKKYKALGGNIKVWVKEGQGHYPLGPDDATPLVNLIQTYQQR